jgi:hypothetical protein
MAYITFENISEIFLENILKKPSKNSKIKNLATSNNKPNNLISKINNINKKY